MITKLFKSIKANLFLKLLFGTFMFLQSCSIQLVPKFDEKIVDNLSSSTEEVFKILADISDGAKMSDYNKREDNYNKIIGKLEALKLQIYSRPQPSNNKIKKLIEKANEILSKRNETKISEAEINPSEKAIEQVISNIYNIKKVDKIHDITKVEADFYKKTIILFFDQALTYEKFLNQ